MAEGDTPGKLPMPEGDIWLTEWISRPRAEGPRARNPRGQPDIARGHRQFARGIPEGTGSFPGYSINDVSQKMCMDSVTYRCNW